MGDGGGPASLIAGRLADKQRVVVNQTVPKLIKIAIVNVVGDSKAGAQIDRCWMLRGGGDHPVSMRHGEIKGAHQQSVEAKSHSAIGSIVAGHDAGNGSAVTVAVGGPEDAKPLIWVERGMVLLNTRVEYANIPFATVEAVRPKTRGETE